MAIVIHGIVRKTVVLAALAVLAVGCGSGNEPASPTSQLPELTTPVTTVPLQPGPTNAGVTDTPPPEPKPAPPQSTTGVAMIFTRTLSNQPVPNVPVNLRLIQPCDPKNDDIPDDGKEVKRWDGVTDATGRAIFTVPVGCYRMGMGQPPAGATPVPEGYHHLFLIRPDSTVEGAFRFQNPVAPDKCSAQTIVSDLAAQGQLYSGQEDWTLAAVRDCADSWGVISWNTPGDTQRIVRRSGDRWSTYVIFPHSTCWSDAAADGVPDRLRGYFPACASRACTAASIVGDLDRQGELSPGQADSSLLQIQDCAGSWALVNWKTPGDTARIVQYTGHSWTTYVRFPHDLCWSQAAKTGVPQRLQAHFSKC
ncbi:hypothetical protein [Nocardia sp. NPDC051832]|uniref:hypothetical protein n=1 Tax=Nocardia sp. NPDC051832 TaxID=3155673 RepID=UPI0034304185